MGVSQITTADCNLIRTISQEAAILFIDPSKAAKIVHYLKTYTISQARLKNLSVSLGCFAILDEVL